jgi:hypothetical protein
MNDVTGIAAYQEDLDKSFSTLGYKTLQPPAYMLEQDMTHKKINDIGLFPMYFFTYNVQCSELTLIM